MYGTHRLASTILGITGLLTSSCAFAVFEPNGLYGIGGIGWGWAEDANLKSVTMVGESIAPVVDTKQEFMFRFGLGTLITDVWGVEFRYNHFNSISSRVGLIDGHTIRMIAYPEYFDLNALLRFEASNNFSLFATLGPGYGRISRTYETTDVNAVIVVDRADSKDSTGWGVAASIGFQYEFTPLWGLRLEFAGLKGRDNIKIGAISGNLVINIL
jgi:opacity protein-like surface antigen